MWAIAQKVVPRSIPTAFREEVAESEALMFAGSKCRYPRGFVAGYVPHYEKHLLLRRRGSEGHEKPLFPLFDHHFLGPKDSVFPEETSFYDAHDVSVIIGILGYF